MRRPSVQNGNPSVDETSQTSYKTGALAAKQNRVRALPAVRKGGPEERCALSRLRRDTSQARQGGLYAIEASEDMPSLPQASGVRNRSMHFAAKNNSGAKW